MMRIHANSGFVDEDENRDENAKLGWSYLKMGNRYWVISECI